MAIIETTTTANQLRFPGQRRIERQTRTGHLFYVSYGSGIIQVYRSVDNGTTWSAFGAQRAAVSTIAEMGSLFVDWQNRLYITYRTNVSSQDRVYMQAAVITATGPSWHTPLLVASAANGGVAGAALAGSAMTIIRHTDGRTTGAVGVGTNGATVGLTLYGFTIPAFGQPVVNNNVIANRRSWTATGSATGRTTPAMGYELSPAHMWVTFGRTYLYAVKCTWNGAGWTAPTSAVRITPGTIGVSATPAALESCASIWRNPGWMVAQPTPEDPTTILLSERNQGNAYTTYKVSLTHPTGNIRHCALALNNQAGNVRIYAVGATNVLYYCDYLASTGTFTSWATVIGSTLLTADDEFSVRRENYQSSNFDVLTMTGGASPWTITHTVQKATYAPLVPTWNETAMARPNGSAADVAASLLLQWNFSDPDAGDSQSAWALSRVIGAGATQYFRASDSTWQATEQKNIGVTTNRTLAAAWGVDGDAPHTYQAKVWDTTDVASNYSVGYVVIPSAKANPSISLSEVVDVNPALDIGFESGVAGFIASGGTLTQSSTFAHTGTKSAKLVTAAASYPKIRRSGNDPVTTGQQYTFDAWLYAPVSLGQQAYVSLEWYNGTTLVSENATLVTLPVGVWTNVSATASTPGGVTGCRRVAGVVGSAPAGLELYLDDAIVLSPWSGTVHTDTIVASWFVTEMTAYRVTLSTNPGGVQVYDSGWLASTNDFTHPIPYRLPDGTTWTIGLQTRNNEGLTSNLVTAGVFVDYSEPPTPTCTVTPVADSGIIRVAIANPAPTVTQPAVSAQTLYRRPRLYSNVLPNPGFESATGGSGWIAADGTGARSTAQAHTGSWSYFVTPNGTGLFPRVDGGYVPVTGTMRAGGWVRAEAGTSPPQIAIHAFDAAGGYIITRGHRRTTAALGQWVYLDTTADFGDIPYAALCTVTLGRGDTITAPAASETFYVDDGWVSPHDPATGDVVVSGVLDRLGSQAATAADTFSRTVSAGWGLPDTGGSVWTATGGSAGDYSVDGSVGKISLGVVNNPQRVTVAVTSAVLAVEDFEDAFFATPITGAWARSTVRALSGTWSMKAGSAGNLGNSDMVVTLPVGTTSVSFYYWTSSEQDFDFLKVIGNGTTLFSDSGIDTSWNFAKVAVPAGVTSLTFQYIKDGGAALGEDTVYVDQLNFIDDSGGKDVDVSCSITCPVVPAGGSVNVGLLARYVDTNNFYLGEMLLNTGGTVTARIRKFVGGVTTTLGTSSAVAGLVPTAGKTYRLRFACQGSSLRVRVWDAGVTEPVGVWHLDLSDTALNPSTSQVGVRAALDVGNTNTLPVVLSFDTFLVTGSLGGGSAASTVDDWQVASGIDYEYQVVAQASSGTSSSGPWTS